MTRTLTAAALLAATLACSSAHAQQPCSDLPRPVYGIGGSAAKPLIGGVAAALSGLADPITVVYQAPGACFGINAYIDDAPLTGTASYWTAAGEEQLCDLPAPDGVPADFAYMGVNPEACAGGFLPEGIGNFEGPISGWSLIVPEASSQRSISSEALYFVYGFGPEGMASPWTVESEVYRRSATSAAQLAISLVSNVPPDRFRGLTDARSNGNMVTLVSSSPTPEAAIGFVSTEVADANRGIVRTLAYQHLGQSCAYWPDSSPTAFDKRNLRDGHYYLWSPHRFYAPIDETGAITDPDTATFVGYVTGATAPTPEVPALDITIGVGVIPQCAMNVRREGDLTALMSFQPDEPCGCYFDFVATGSTSCTACDDDSDCGADAPSCRFGYCEVR